MYRSEEENQRLFEAIAQNFPQAHLLFDVVSPRFVDADAAKHPHQPADFFGESDVEFSWGMGDVSDLQSWNLQIDQVECLEYLTNIVSYPERLETWMNNFWPILKPLLAESGRIYHLQLR